MRTTVRLGDPGIDERWMRRRTTGVALAIAWLLATTLGIGIMTATKCGPPGWIQAWQLREYGGTNPLLAALPLMPLVFMPALATLMPTSLDRPMLLGMQQAFSRKREPRVAEKASGRDGPVAYAMWMTLLAAGLATMAAGAGWAWWASSRAPAAPVAVTHADVVAGRAPPGQVLVTDVVEGEARWIESTRLRTTSIHDEWRGLAPNGDGLPLDLVEKIAVGVDGDGRARVYARKGTIGRVRRLDDWHADALRQKGFVLADRAWVLERSLGDEGDAMDAAGSGTILALVGLVLTYAGGVGVLAIRRKRSRTSRRRQEA